MGGFSIPGPIIKFQFDESDFTAQVQGILGSISKQVVAQNKQISQSISQQIANPLIAQAAQLRALYSTGSLAIKDLQTQQKNLLGLLDQEISKLVTRNDLSNKELSTLKALTLERERQQNALNRGTGVGVTAGTQSALGLVSGPIIANISRLGTGLLGIAGGSGGSDGGAAFAGAAAEITSITAAGGPAVAILGALTAALVASGGAAVALATSGGALVQNLSNISQRTGISIQNLQALQAVANVSNLGLDDLVTGFRKFSQVLTGGGTDDNGDFQTATKKSTEILQALGVTSKDSFTALEQTATAFQKLPDGPTKAAVAIQLFGRSGLQLIPILNQGADGVEKYRTAVQSLGPVFGPEAIQAQKNYQDATVNLGLAFDNLKVKLTPLLNNLADLKNGAAALLNTTVSNPSGAAGAIFSGLITGLGSQSATIGDISTNLALLPAPVDKLGASAVTTGSSLDKMFTIAEKGGSRLKTTLDGILAGNFDEFLKKINENAKEFEQSQIERGNSAQSQINDILAKAPPGASESDRIVADMNKQIADLTSKVTGLPGLAEAAAAAIAKLMSDTISGLSQIESDSLEKASETVEKMLDDESNKRIAINTILKEAQDQLAADAAAANDSAIQRIIADEQKRYDAQAKIYALQGANEQDFANLRVTLEADASQRILKLRQDELDRTNKEIEQQAGQLFDALLRGGGSFTTALKNSLQNLLLAPVKQVFEAVIGGIFTQPIQALKDELAKFGKSLQDNNPAGSILNRIGKNLAGPDAVGNNTQQVNLNTTATDANTQALLRLNGILTGTSPQGIPGSTAPSAGGGFGQVLFGGAGGAGGLILHGLPPSGGGSASSPLSQLGSAGLGLNFLLGLGNLVGGISGHNTGQAIGGGVSIAGGALGKIGQIIGKSNPDLGVTLGQAGGIIGGAGLVISGVSQGGIGGGLSSAIGGAEIGTAIAPGIGTAIGAIAGFAAGLIGGLFGHKGATASQINAAIARQTVDPNLSVGMEFDRSAQGTFAQTLASNFSSGPGGTFGNASIPSVPPPPPPSVTVNVSAIDAKGVAQFVTQYGQTIAKVVGGQINTTQSGLARGVRTAVSPA